MGKINRLRFRPTSPNINPSSIARIALVLIPYLALFTGLDWLSRSFQVLPGIVIWYPPDGLSFALLLTFGGAWWPAVALASLISSLFIYQLAFPPLALFAWAIFISVVYGISAEFLRRRIRMNLDLSNLRDVLWLTCVSGIAALVLAVVAVSAHFASGALQEAARLNATLHWWIGEIVGILALTPMLLIYIMPRVRKFVEGRRNDSPWKYYPSLRPTGGSVVRGLSLLAALYLAFGVKVLGPFQPLLIIALPLTWIALQDGISGTALAVAAVNFGTAL